MLNSIQEAARDQFDRQSARYGKSHILADVADVRAALQHVPVPTGAATALDVATGAGHTALALAEAGYRVTASDISAKMLDQVAAAALEKGVEVERRQHPAEALPYDKGAFDLVASRVAPHHFSDQSAFVVESARVLKKGGYFILIDGSVPDNDAEADQWLHEVEIARDPSHHRLQSPSVWGKWCEEAGMTVVHSVLHQFKQPDLEWYFDTAATTPENRKKVHALIEEVSPHVREVYRVGTEEGRITWWWPRLTLVAAKLEQP